GQGIIHGDLKPSNLKCQENDSQDWQLKILDFGLANWVTSSSLGTPAYTAPERILGEALDARSDLYSLGLVFYEAMTGKHPLVHKELSQTLQAHLSQKVPSATLVRSEIPPKFSRLLSQLLEKNPRHRPPSAQAILADFFHEEEIFPVSPPPPDLKPLYLHGRQKLIQEAEAWLKAQDTSHPQGILAFVGEKEWGGEAMLTELKYRAQLQGLSLNFAKPQDFEPEVSASSAASFRISEEIETGPFLKDQSTREFPPEVLQKQFKTKIENLKKGAWVLSLLPKQIEKLKKLAPQPIKILHLKPLSETELKEVLALLSQTMVPQALSKSLWHYSQGSQELLETSLSHLLKDPKILQSHGAWNLSPFQEAPPTAESLGLDQSGLKLPKGLKDKERWQIQLKQATRLSSLGQSETALKLIQDLEEEVKNIFSKQEQSLAMAELLEKKAWTQIHLGKKLKARENLARALAHWELAENKSKTQELRIKNFLSYLDLQEGKLEEAQKSFEESRQLSSQLDEKEKQLVTNNELGQVYLAQEKIKEAISQFKEDLKLFEQLPENRLKMKAHYYLAEALTLAESYQEAEKQYEAVLNLARQERHWAYLLRAYNGLGNLANRQKKRARAMDFYSRALSLAEYEGENLSQASILQNLGVLYAEEERYEEAIKSLEKSQDYLKKTESSRHSRHLMVRSLLELGEIYFLKGSFDSAKSCFKESLNRSQEEESLHSFLFYPLLGLAKLAREENDQDAWEILIPQLHHQAKTEEQKKQIKDLQIKNKNLTNPKLSTSNTLPSLENSFEKSAL
ncbi:MAG: serine/threonine protein kinase, partial [Deltaproteobacteria bacterium]|nr:serine/threonine protein kinase [Deltaproteobacteria bacterium]